MDIELTYQSTGENISMAEKQQGITLMVNNQNWRGN